MNNLDYLKKEATKYMTKEQYQAAFDETPVKISKKKNVKKSKENDFVNNNYTKQFLNATSS